MFGAVALGLALVAVSSRSERAMFQSGLPMPGVFATIGTELAENPRLFLRGDRDPSAFFARLDPGVDEPAPAAEDEGVLAPIERALVFVGPDEQLPAPGPIEIAPPFRHRSWSPTFPTGRSLPTALIRRARQR